MHDDLLSYVRGVLAGYDGSMRLLAKEIGVKERWLRMIKDDEIPNPGIVGIQKIAEHFRRRHTTPRADNTRDSAKQQISD